MKLVLKISIGMLVFLLRSPPSPAQNFSGWFNFYLNPATLDRLENLLAEMKQNGVYACINLHVGRTFNSLDGLPDADSLQDYEKAINYFDPQIVFLHKEFARQFLTHVSPYTGRTLAADPVMAMAKWTNESLRQNKERRCS
jgi:hypothetical protein